MKENYNYVKNMLSPDMVQFLTSFSLKNFTNGDSQVPLSSASHSKSSDIYNHITHYLLPRMEKETNSCEESLFRYRQARIS